LFFAELHHHNNLLEKVVKNIKKFRTLKIIFICYIFKEVSEHFKIFS
jgi:hypothetical protein